MLCSVLNGLLPTCTNTMYRCYLEYYGFAASNEFAKCKGFPFPLVVQDKRDM